MSVAVVAPSTAREVARDAVAGVRATRRMQVKVLQERYAKDRAEFEAKSTFERLGLRLRGRAPLDPSIPVGWCESAIEYAERRGEVLIDKAKDIIDASQRAYELRIDVEDWAALLRYAQARRSAST